MCKNEYLWSKGIMHQRDTLKPSFVRAWRKCVVNIFLAIKVPTKAEDELMFLENKAVFPNAYKVLEPIPTQGRP